MTRTAYILLVLLALTIFLYSFRSLNESDNFYHLKAGQIIWETKQVPRADILSFTAAGAPWITHEWLAELIFYGVWAHLGFWGLIVLAALLALLSYFILLRLGREEGARFSALCLAALLVGVFTFQLWTVRPQIFGYLGLVILLFLLERYRRTQRTVYLLLALLDIFVWANMHASFVLGIGLIGFYGVVGFLRTRWPERFGISSLTARDACKLLLFTLLAVFVALANPNTYHAFFYSIAIRPVAHALHFYEWRPITAYFCEAEVKLDLLLILATLALAAWWFGVRKESRDATALGLVLLGSALPFLSVRHMGIWALLVLVPLARALTGALAERRAVAMLSPLLLAALVLLLLGRAINLPHAYFTPVTIPVYAADFVHAQGLKGPLFNMVNEGGYLIWRFWPEEKVFIDSRSEVYQGKPLEEYLAVARGDETQWRALVDEKYRINYFFFSYLPKTPGESVARLVRALMNNNWALVYWDDAAVIFARNIPENAALIRDFGLRHVSPFRDPKTIRPEERAAAEAELSRLLTLSPATETVRRYGEAFLASQK